MEKPTTCPTVKLVRPFTHSEKKPASFSIEPVTPAHLQRMDSSNTLPTIEEALYTDQKHARSCLELPFGKSIH